MSQANARAVSAVPAAPRRTGFSAGPDELPEQQPAGLEQAAAAPLAHPAVPGSGGHDDRQDDPGVNAAPVAGSARPGDASSTSVAASGPGERGLGLMAAGLPCLEGTRRVLQASYPGEKESVGQLRHQVAVALARVPCAEDAIFALNEVATNAVVHSRSGQDGGEFTVAVDVVPGVLVAFAVADQGGPWHESGPDFYLHGLGIVGEMAAEVRVDGGEAGRTVWVSFPWVART